MEINLEKNKTEAQSQRPQAGNEELQTEFPQFAEGSGHQGSPKGLLQIFQIFQIFQVFPCPCRPSQGQPHVGEMPLTVISEANTPGRHEHISDSKKQIRIKFLVLLQEASVLWERLYLELQGGQTPRPSTSPAWSHISLTPHQRQEPEANRISKGFVSVHGERNPPAAGNGAE